MANTVQQIKNKESQLKSQGAVLGQNTNPQVTTKSTKQIGQAGSITGAGSTAGLQTIPNLMPEAKSNVKTTNQAGQSDVGTGAVAGMYTAPNFMQEANKQAKQNEINQLAVNQKNQNKQNNNEVVQQQTPQTSNQNVNKGTGGVKYVNKGGKITPVEEDWRAGLKNADVNLSQYGDDSSEANYNNRDLWGGQNEKYTGEGVKNSNINYDPNATLENLDPNYMYGQEAQIANSNDAGYIARRNDQIASALYNAGLTDINDVRNFLNGQKGFQNSNENERENTIMSIWKRLGDMSAGQQDMGTYKQQDVKQGTTTPEMDLSKEKNQTGTIYGKTTADTGTPSNGIKTLADVNSIDAKIVQARQNNYTALSGMNSYDIALSISAGTDPYGSQAMRDLMQYNPAKYQEVQAELKKINGMEDVNNIAQGGTVNKTTQIGSANESVNNDISNRALSNSNERNYDDTLNLLTTKLSSSGTAQTATQEMLNLNSQMAELEEKMNNLPKEASKYFKGDVPQYIVDAFVANRSSQYQSEMNKLQSRYNSAVDLYKTELSQKQWEAEMELKERQFQQQINQQNWSNAFQANQQAWTQYYQGQQLKMSQIKTDSKGRPYMLNSDGSFQYLTDNTYTQAIQQQVQQGVQSLNAVYQDGMDGGQCEVFTDNFNQSVYGQTMVPRDAQGNIIQGRTYTTASEKASYVNMATPVLGSTAVFNYGTNANVSDSAKKYGHTMLVTGYDAGTGMVTLKGSNKDGSEKVYTQTMSLNDFYSKGGVGFWDPAKDIKLQAQSGVVSSQNPGSPMIGTYETLLSNATTDGQRDTISTAMTMYDVLSGLRDNGSLNALIETGDLKKILASFDQRKFGKDDGGSVFADQLQKAMSKKSLNTQSQIALNQLYMLVEMKLRNESGAAISSSEWYSNFNMMLPQAYENKDVMTSKLSNWDTVIRRYSMKGGLKYSDYIPIFSSGAISTRQTR